MKRLLVLMLIWTVSGPAVAEVIPQGGRQFFVANNGSDSNNGRFAVRGASNTTGEPGAGNDGPWLTLAKVNDSPMETRDDVYLRAGDTWLEQLTIDWYGTDGDRVVIGTYYVSNGIAHENTPVNPTAWPTAYTYTQPRAVIKGSCDFPSWAIGGVDSKPGVLNTACKFNNQDRFPVNNPSGAIPSNDLRGLVEIAADYVTIQDIKVTGSGGQGVSVAQSDVDFPTGITLQRLYVDNIYQQGIVFTNPVRAIVRDTVVRHAGMSISPNPGVSNPTNPAAIIYGNNPWTTHRQDNLMEGNDVALTNTGIQYFRGNRGLIIRGNRIADLVTNHPCIYGDWGDDIVIEYNICVGGGYAGGGYPYRSRGIYQTRESNNSTTNYGGALTGHVIRGNMLVNTMDCIGFEIGLFDGIGNLAESRPIPTVGNPPTNADMPFSARIYNNSCLNATGVALDLTSQYMVIGPDGFDVRNNIFQSNLTQGGPPASVPTPDPDICQTPTAPNPFSAIDYNMWNALPTVVACRGAHDVTGTAVVAGTNMATKNATTNLATPADFALQAGSPGLAAGTPIGATIMIAGDFPQTADIRYPCATFDLKGSMVDAVCATRHATTPDLGAMGGVRGPFIDFGLTVE